MQGKYEKELRKTMISLLIHNYIGKVQFFLNFGLCSRYLLDYLLAYHVEPYHIPFIISMVAIILLNMDLHLRNAQRISDKNIYIMLSNII